MELGAIVVLGVLAVLAVLMIVGGGRGNGGRVGDHDSMPRQRRPWTQNTVPVACQCKALRRVDEKEEEDARTSSGGRCCGLSERLCRPLARVGFADRLGRSGWVGEDSCTGYEDRECENAGALRDAPFLVRVLRGLGPAARIRGIQMQRLSRPCSFPYIAHCRLRCRD